MSTAQLIVLRYNELLDNGKVAAAVNYLAEDVIYKTWLGVVEGRDNVITFLHDNLRNLYQKRRPGSWQQVLHTLDPAVQDSGGWLDEDGYDVQGFATFERDNAIAKHRHIPVDLQRVRETVVVRRNYIVLVSIHRQL